MDTERHERTWGLYTVKCFLAGTIVFLFGLAGSFTGAITGAIAGRATQSGIIRGAGVGAIAGAALSIEVFEALRAFWIVQQSGSRGQSSIVDLLEELFSGRFVEQAYPPGVFTGRHWQMRVADMTHESDNIFGDIAPRGLSGDLLNKLPCHVITEDTRTAQNKSCTICLQDIEIGEIVRSLPRCNHTFHSTCVDKWLIRQGSCPVCRQDV